jgi:ribonuclease Z
MRPTLHPSLVNGRTGDPALYVETLFERRAMLFDLGDISALPPRKILRLGHIFISHAHIDHFIGFDHLLRLLVGRDRTVRLYGPAGFAGHVGHKLHAYRWNLVDRFEADLVFVVTEIDASMNTGVVRFRLKNGFAAEPVGGGRLAGCVVCAEPMFQVSTTILEHRTPCLGFAIEETAHVNVWKNRLEELGLPVGLWLRDLKRAVVEHRPDGNLVRIDGERAMPLGELRSAVTVTPG